MYHFIGTGTTPISLPYHSTAHLNCTAMINVDLCQDPRGSCYAGGDFIPSNTSVSNCCPVTVSVTSSVKGRPTRSALGVSCEIGCGKQAVNACSWELHFTGMYTSLVYIGSILISLLEIKLINPKPSYERVWFLCVTCILGLILYILSSPVHF